MRLNLLLVFVSTFLTLIFLELFLILIDYGRPHLSRWDMEKKGILNHNLDIM